MADDHQNCLIVAKICPSAPEWAYTKIDWPTNRRSQCDVAFDFNLTLLSCRYKFVAAMS
jgi:hypothetical protein